MVTPDSICIILVDCVVVAEGHLKDFVVGLTDENPAVTPPVYKQYFHVQYKGMVKPGATASVTFPESGHMFRYVVIQNEFPRHRSICLAEVEVYVTRK